MVEILKHTLGLCGEHWHPNLLNTGALTAGLTGTVTYIKYTIATSYGKRISEK